MPPTTKTAAPRRLTRLKVNEVSLCHSPANPHAVALIAKAADTAADLDRRLGALEHQQAMRDAPARLLAKMAERGEELAAAAQGRQYVPTIPDTVVAKDASGGARLIARCTELRKSMIAVAAPVPAQSPPVTKAAASPAQGLIAAAHRRAAMMKAG